MGSSWPYLYQHQSTVIPIGRIDHHWTHQCFNTDNKTTIGSSYKHIYNCQVRACTPFISVATKLSDKTPIHNPTLSHKFWVHPPQSPMMVMVWRLMIDNGYSPWSYGWNHQWPCFNRFSVALVSPSPALGLEPPQSAAQRRLARPKVRVVKLW